MRKFGSKLSLSRATVRVVADGLSLVGGGEWSDYIGCSIACGADWDSDIVKGRVGGGK